MAVYSDTAITLNSGGFSNLSAGVLTGKYQAYHSLLVNDGQVATVDAANIDLESGGAIEFFNSATQQYEPLQATLKTIAQGGTLEIGKQVAQFGDLQDNGTILLNGGPNSPADVNFAPANLTIGSGGILEGTGTLGAAIVNDRIIEASVTSPGGPDYSTDYIVVDASVTASGYFEIDGAPALNAKLFVGGTIELVGPQSQDVLFAQGTGTLKLDAPESFSGDIIVPKFLGSPGSAVNIELKGIAYSSVTHYSYSGNALGGVLSIDTTSGDYSFHFVGDLQTSNFTLSNGSTLSTLPPVLDVTVTPGCYGAGTRIATVRGEIRIENLRVGDLALTASGALRPVRWIGWRAIETTNHPAPHDVWPVRICANAFGEGIPRRDLLVSPGHNIAFGGALIPAIALANGATVRQLERDHVTYFHVELDSHDILLAEGLPAESYLDCGNRGAFSNGGAFLELHPNFAPRTEGETYLPIRKSGPVVALAKASLLARAEKLGFATTADPDLHLLVDGVRIEPRRYEGRRYHFTLSTGARNISLISRVWTPAHMWPDSAIDCSLGVLVVGLSLDGARVPLDSLAGGWLDGDVHLRWTDGCAALPAGVRRISVDLDGEPLYFEEPPAESDGFDVTPRAA
jgi:hypothetical protein